MKLKTVSMLAAVAVGSCFGQQPASQATALKGSYNYVKTNLLKAAEKMPEDQYSFKASSDIRSFGELIGHIADSQGRGCAFVSKADAPPSAAKMTAKADLVGALKNAFSVCDTIFDGLTDADASKTVESPRGARNMFSILWGGIAHDNEEYGYLAVYMRLKGIVPPSSEPKN